MFRRPCLKYQFDVNQFEFKDNIGEGGFGKVQLVKDTKTDDLYALKIIEHSDNDNKVFRELDLMINIEHPTMTKCYGYFSETNESGNKLYLLMDYAKNSSLDKVIDSVTKGLIVDIIYSNTHRQIILTGIARGMKYLHDRNIVHRDLKTSNILIDENYYPHISDLGLAKQIKKGHTLDQSVIGGTIYYMAPEIFTEDNFDAKKCDVYSFGILMYEIITDSIIDDNIYKAFKKQDYSIFNTKRIKKSFQDLIKQCLLENPNERPTFKEIFEKISSIENEDYLLDNVDIDDYIKYIELITKVTDQFEELLIANEKLAKKNDDLLKKNQDLKKKNQDLTKNNDDLTEKNNELTDINKDLDKKYKNITKKSLKTKTSMENQINDLQDENNCLLQQVQNYKTNILSNTIKVFNSIPLKLQQFIISEIIEDENKMYLFFIKINELMLFLLQFKNLETMNCIQINADKDDIYIQEIDKEYPITILSDATNTLILKNVMKTPEFVNIIKVFDHFSIDLKYPLSNFDYKYNYLIQQVEPLFNKDQIKIVIFITGIETSSSFNKNKKIRNVKLDSSVKKITGGLIFSAFNGCTSLKEIIIPTSVHTIGLNAFYGSGLEEISLPSSLEYIGSSAFEKCGLLKKISIPSSVTHISICAFKECVSLVDIKLNASINIIEANTFDYCISLKKIEIPNSVTKIDEFAFKGCKLLKQILIPKTIKEIGYNAIPNTTEIVIKTE